MSMESIYCKGPNWFKGEKGVGGQPVINIETNQTHLCCINDTGHALFLLACVLKFRNAGPKMNAV